jgi:hypothetical protein
MEEGAHTAETEEIVGEGGGIVPPTDPPPHPAATSSNDAANNNLRRSFKELSPDVLSRAAAFRGGTR